VQDNYIEGTRQNCPVTSGEGVPLKVKGVIKKEAATVYQKHRTLRSWKTR